MTWFRLRLAFARLAYPDVPQDSTMSNSLYEQDFFAWANEQAALLRAGRLHDIDIENVVEEIEGLGRRQKRELVDRLAELLADLLNGGTSRAFAATVGV